MVNLMVNLIVSIVRWDTLRIMDLWFWIHNI